MIGKIGMKHLSTSPERAIEITFPVEKNTETAIQAVESILF